MTEKEFIDYINQGYNLIPLSLSIKNSKACTRNCERDKRGFKYPSKKSIRNQERIQGNVQKFDG